jgi:hypothetical protein
MRLILPSSASCSGGTRWPTLLAAVQNELIEWLAFRCSRDSVAVQCKVRHDGFKVWWWARHAICVSKGQCGCTSVIGSMAYASAEPPRATVEAAGLRVS